MTESILEKYAFKGDEFSDQRLEISSNYHSWDAALGKRAPIYIEILDGNDEYASTESIGLSLKDARDLIESLTEIVNYLEEKND